MTDLLNSILCDIDKNENLFSRNIHTKTITYGDYGKSSVCIYQAYRHLLLSVDDNYPFQIYILSENELSAHHNLDGELNVNDYYMTFGSDGNPHTIILRPEFCGLIIFYDYDDTCKCCPFWCMYYILVNEDGAYCIGDKSYETTNYMNGQLYAYLDSHADKWTDGILWGSLVKTGKYLPKIHPLSKDWFEKKEDIAPYMKDQILRAWGIDKLEGRCM